MSPPPVEPLSIDHVEFFVSDANIVAFFYRVVLGLRPWFFSGPETGLIDRIHIGLQANDVRLVFTSSVNPNDPIAQHVSTHGDGVGVVAFRTRERTRTHHVVELMPRKPEVQADDVVEGLGPFGDVRYRIVPPHACVPALFPSSIKLEPQPPLGPCYVRRIDHLAIAVARSSLTKMYEQHHELFGLRIAHREKVDTTRSGMDSVVLRDDASRVTLVFMEPLEGPEPSQIADFLHHNRGEGVQHVAFLCDDIFHTSKWMRESGVRFLHIPSSYYEDARKRLGTLPVDPQAAEEHRILLDQDDDGLLLQTFTKPIHTRPTFFVELVERRGARGFGSANIRALFEAVEREQQRRSVRPR